MIDSMKNAFKVCQMFLLMCGVFGAETDEVKTVSVMEGDSVTLNPDPSKILDFIQMKWRFGDSGPVIANFDKKKISYPSVPEMFEDRLKMNPTGSLTITNMRTKHAGLYKLQIDHNTGPLYENFRVIVYESPDVIGAVKGETKSVSVMEGESDTLQTDTETHGDELIVWRFGDEEKLIAKHDIEAKSSPSYTDERFRDRLKLNNQTGSLTITNFRITDSGLYRVKISSSRKTVNKRFSVSVSGSGLSGGAVAGIVVLLLLVFSAAAGVFYYRRKLSELQNLMRRQVNKSVLKGRSVTLKCVTEIQKKDKIQWMFGAEQKLIAEMTGENCENPEWFADEFRDQMTLDPQTGSLNIHHTRPEHSGLYKLVISRSYYSASTLFTLIVFDEEKSVPVMEEADVTLRAKAGKLTRDHKIFWMFGDDNCLIAKNTEDECEESKNSGLPFKGGVDLNRQTGDLTIKNITTSHSGYYKLKIIRNGKTSFKLFIVIVYVRQEHLSMLKGDSVTLKCDTEIQKDEKIQWMFGAEQKLIAEMTGENCENPEWFAKEFKHQMKLDPQTGSLIIQHTKHEHTGLYKIVINRSDYSTFRLFSLFVFDEEESMMKMEGTDVTLRAKTGEQAGDHKIFWMFGNDNCLIAKNTEDECEESKISDLTFKRVDLNRQTGDLTIKKIKTSHSGKYKLKIIRNGKTSFKLFRVAVSAAPSEEEEKSGGSEEKTKSGGSEEKTKSGGSEEKTKSLMKEERENDSTTVSMPLLDGANERETTSSL